MAATIADATERLVKKGERSLVENFDLDPVDVRLCRLGIQDAMTVFSVAGGVAKCAATPLKVTAKATQQAANATRFRTLAERSGLRGATIVEAIEANPGTKALDLARPKPVPPKPKTTTTTSSGQIKPVGDKVNKVQDPAKTGQKRVLPAPENDIPRLWKKTDVHTFRGQTNKVHKRDDLIDLNKMDGRGKTNLQLMTEGKAPIGSDGKPINLHHLVQTQDSALAEVTTTMHTKYHRVLHIWTNSSKGGVTRAEKLPSINRAEFDTWKSDYWKARLKELMETKK